MRFAACILPVLGVLVLGLLAVAGYAVSTVGLVLAPWLAWETFKKLTAEKPVDGYSGAHASFFLLGCAVVLIGAGLAITGGDFENVLSRVAGLLGAVGGGVMLEAERRDYRRWRASVDAETRSR